MNGWSWMVVTACAGSLTLEAQITPDSLSSARLVPLGGADDHVIGVNVDADGKPIWYGYGWTADGGMQGRLYRADQTVDVGWAKDGVVQGMAGDYVIGTSGSLGLIADRTSTNALPDLAGSDPLTPVGVNSGGVVVGFSFAGAAFRFDHGVLAALPTTYELPGSAVAVADDGTMVGHLFADDGVSIIAVVWDNGACVPLSDATHESYAVCLGGGRVGGELAGQFAYWEKAGGQWISHVVQSNSVPVLGRVACLTKGGYFGGGGQAGGACFGKLGQPAQYDLSSVPGFPTRTVSVVGMVELADRVILAIDCDAAAYGLIIPIAPAAPPPLTITLGEGKARIAWPLTPGVMLQSNLAANPTGWQDVPPPYSTTATETFVEVAPTDSATFFRLRSE